MEHLLELAKRNQERAWEVIRQTDIINIWKSVGAEINLVGSLNMGLLMKHKDIDFHIYTSPFRISDSFQAMARLAENPLIKRIEYGNSLDTEEQCVEWHAWFQDPDNELWQIIFNRTHILLDTVISTYSIRCREIFIFVIKI